MNPEQKAAIDWIVAATSEKILIPQSNDANRRLIPLSYYIFPQPKYKFDETYQEWTSADPWIKLLHRDTGTTNGEQYVYHTSPNLNSQVLEGHQQRVKPVRVDPQRKSVA